jgi:hypothetical protein
MASDKFYFTIEYVYYIGLYNTDLSLMYSDFASAFSEPSLSRSYALRNHFLPSFRLTHVLMTTVLGVGIGKR